MVFHLGFFLEQMFWLEEKTKVLLTTSTTALLYCVSQLLINYTGPETEAAKWKSAIIYMFIHAFAFHAVMSSFCWKGLLQFFVFFCISVYLSLDFSSCL